MSQNKDLYVVAFVSSLVSVSVLVFSNVISRAFTDAQRLRNSSFSL